MGQTRNNNLSPLPFYGSVEEQECRLPWAFGDVFPLRCGGNRIPPFFIVRPQRGEFVSEGTELTAKRSFEGFLKKGGEIITAQGSVARLTEYACPDNRVIWVENLPKPMEITGGGTINVAGFSASGECLSSLALVTTDATYTGRVTFPQGTDTIYIQTTTGEEDEAAVYATIVATTSVKEVVAISCEDGTETALDYVLEDIQIYNYGDTDVICSNTGGVTLANGTYYLRLSDGEQTWYSEMFTYGALPNLLLIWNDVTDQRLPDGVIPYSKGYRNAVYLNSAVGFPEYETEKEGDERDGYFFMEKGVSRKAYRFTFFAPEYLCDALRLVAVSDKVTIRDTSRGAAVVYDVDDIDMEVEWLEQGNYAQVTFTFHTDTVVKNLGKII